MRALAAEEREPARSVSRPSRRQIYALANLLLERQGLAWPDSEREAAALLERLRTTR